MGNAPLPGTVMVTVLSLNFKVPPVTDNAGDPGAYDKITPPEARSRLPLMTPVAPVASRNWPGASESPPDTSDTSRVAPGLMLIAEELPMDAVEERESLPPA